MVKGEGLFSFRFSNFRFCSNSRYFGIKIWGFFWYLAKKIWGFFWYLAKKIWGFFFLKPKSFGDSGVMVIKCENLQLHSRGLSYILLKCMYRGYLCCNPFLESPVMAHNVFVNEHIVMLADSFTRKRAMHINIAKVIFSIENTT